MHVSEGGNTYSDSAKNVRRAAGRLKLASFCIASFLAGCILSHEFDKHIFEKVLTKYEQALSSCANAKNH